MLDVEYTKKLEEIKKATASETAIRKYLYEQEDGVTYHNGNRQVNTGFKKLQQDANDLMNKLDTNADQEDSIIMKKELIKAKGWVSLYNGSKESIYRDLLSNDKTLSLLSKPVEGNKRIDSQLIIDELGEEKGNNLLSQYFIKNQLNIRQNLESLHTPSLLKMVDAFSDKNKIGLNGNEHYITINLEKKGPFNNEEFAKFVSQSPELKYKKNDYYYNPDQKGWKSFDNSEAVQLAYLKEKVTKGDNLTLNVKNISENHVILDNFFKELVTEERKLPTKSINPRLRY